MHTVPTTSVSSIPMAAQSASRTCLLDAFVALPDLAEACCRTSSLRTIRLVSKGMKDAVRSAVEGYTLELGCDDQLDSAEVMSFLSTSRLRRLRIMVPDLNDCVQGLQDVTERLTAQLTSFVTSLASALSSITRLTIIITATEAQDEDASESTHNEDLYENSDDENQGLLYNIAAMEAASAATEATTLVLLSLLPACTNLTTLSVTGRIGSCFLQLLGSSCPHIAHLIANLDLLLPSTLSQLPTLLPHVILLDLLPAFDSADLQGLYHPLPLSAAAEQRELSACLAIACWPRLISVDTGSLALTENIWMSLPKGLELLSCPASSDLPGPTWERHDGLLGVKVLGDCVDVALLASLLWAAPKLRNLSVQHRSRDPCFVQLGYSRRDADDLQLVDKYIKAGTVSFACRMKGEAGIMCVPTEPGLHFCGEEVWRNDEHFVLEHCMRQCMDTHISIPLCGYSVVQFTNAHAKGKERGCLSHISRVFPDVEFLDVSNIDLGFQDMVSLASCRSLRELRLSTVGSICTHDLRALCRGSTSLESVHLFDCGGICLKSGLDIERHGGKLHGVKVEIERGLVLEEEDEQDREEDEGTEREAWVQEIYEKEVARDSSW